MAVLAVVGGGVALFMSGSGESERTTELATITKEEVTFEQIDLADDVSVDRGWTIDEDALTSTATITNDSDDERWVVYDEVVPDPFRRDVELDEIEADDLEPDVRRGDRFVRFVARLGAGDSFDVTYDADLDAAPTLDELEAWTTEMDESFAEHLSDDELSPSDGDVDGVVDSEDECPDDAGTVTGCPDGDDDGVPDIADACPSDAGDVEGCPDDDGDGLIDDEDRCPSDPGDVEGCPDSDGDGVLDSDDPCPSDAGEVQGCPDSDGDGVIDDEDRCAGDAGTANGCPDGDQDGVADRDDVCPDRAGEFDGCPDNLAFYGDMYTIALAQVEEFDRIVTAYDPDGDGFTDDFSRYCGEVRNNEQVSADNLQRSIDTYRAELSPETLAIADRTVVNARNNVTLVGSCAGGARRGPWEIDGSGWTATCALWNPLVARSGDEPLDC